MGISLQIPPLLDAILTLSAMLGLFAYVYWLAGKEDRQMYGLDEIKRSSSPRFSHPPDALTETTRAL
jgi:hypothetical protein